MESLDAALAEVVASCERGESDQAILQDVLHALTVAAAEALIDTVDLESLLSENLAALGELLRMAVARTCITAKLAREMGGDETMLERLVKLDCLRYETRRGKRVLVPVEPRSSRARRADKVRDMAETGSAVRLTGGTSADRLAFAEQLLALARRLGSDSTLVVVTEPGDVVHAPNGAWIYVEDGVASGAIQAELMERRGQLRWVFGDATASAWDRAIREGCARPDVYYHVSAGFAPVDVTAHEVPAGRAGPSQASRRSERL